MVLNRKRKIAVIGRRISDPERVQNMKNSEFQSKKMNNFKSENVPKMNQKMNSPRQEQGLPDTKSAKINCTYITPQLVAPGKIKMLGLDKGYPDPKSPRMNSEKNSKMNLDVKNSVVKGKNKNSFDCLSCGKTYTTKSNLTKHIKVVHENFRSYCPIKDCRQGFSSSSFIRKHMSKKHNGSKITCAACGKYFATPNKMLKHFEIHHRELLNENVDMNQDENKSSALIGGINQNVSVEDGDEDTTYVQDDDFANKVIGEYLTNVQDENQGGDNNSSHKENFIESDPEKNNKIKVLKSLGSDDTRSCITCDKVFSRVSDLKKHINVVHCNNKFEELSNKIDENTEDENDLDQDKTSNLSVDEYIDENHEEINLDQLEISNPFVDDNRDSNKYDKSAENCENNVDDIKTIVEKGNINENQMVFEEEKNAINTLPIISLPQNSVYNQVAKTSNMCEYCGKSFSKNHNMKVHVKTVHCGDKRFECNLCDKGFSSKSSLGKHLNRVHDVVGGYPCPYCNQTFTVKVHLEDHLRSVHNGEPLRCDQCVKTFKVYQTFNLHVRTVHKGVKYSCHECSMQYKSQVMVNRHVENVHRGKKFPCDFCEKISNNKQSLKYHIQVVHENKRYKCEVCMKSYTRKEVFQNHMYRFHGDFLNPYHLRLLNENEGLKEKNVILKIENGRLVLKTEELNQEIEKVSSYNKQLVGEISQMKKSDKEKIVEKRKKISKI